MSAKSRENVPLLYRFWTIEAEFLQRRTADGSQSDDFTLIPAPRKVIEPVVSARMIQLHVPVCFGIECRRRGGLRAVASRAGVAQV